MNTRNTSTQKQASLIPVAKIIKTADGLRGEIVGSQTRVDHVCEKVYRAATMLGCSKCCVERLHDDSGQYTAHIEVIPRIGHQLGKNPEQVLLQTIFSDARKGFPGESVQFNQ